MTRVLPLSTLELAWHVFSRRIEQRRGTNLSRIIIQITLSLSLLVFTITSLLPFLSLEQKKRWRFDPESRHCDSLKFDCGGGALPGGESMFTIPRVSSSRIVLVDQRWRDLDGRQGNVINFERDFYCGRGGGVRVRLNVWRFIGSLKSFTATGKSCNKRPWTGDKIERRNSAAKLQRIV